MALTLVSKYSISTDAAKLYVKDITGATGATAWGGTNPSIANSCLFAIVAKKLTTGDSYLSMNTGSQFIYDNAASNAKETEFIFNFGIDAVHDITLGMLPVSLNGSTYVTTGAIADNVYFYWVNGVNVVWKMTAGTPVAVTDYSELLANATTVVQTKVTDILYPKLAMKKQAIYKEYRIERTKNCNSEGDLFNKLLLLKEDLAGASYAFYSGLKTEAQVQLESLIEEHQIV